jgi:hypothetical protein
MKTRTVPLSLVQRVTRQNTSTDQHPQARDRLSRALFATRSATQFDLSQGCSTPATSRSASADPVNSFNRDQIALDDVHDAISADAQPQHLSPRNDCAGYGSPASASKAATTARMPSASSRNREAVVTALGDHSTLTGRHRAAACAPARMRWRQAAQPLTTPGTPPRLPRSPHPPVPAEMPTAPAPAGAGTQLPEQQQQPHRPDESPHAGRRRLTRQAVQSWRLRYLPQPTVPRRYAAPAQTRTGCRSPSQARAWSARLSAQACRQCSRTLSPPGR